MRLVLPAEDEQVLSGGKKENLKGLEALYAHVVRMDVVHRTDKDDPSTERVITANDQPESIKLSGPLSDLAPRQIAFLNVPAGWVYQVRFVTDALSLELRGKQYEVKLPSGENTGLKIIPRDGEPFQITEDERTAIEIQLDPYAQLVGNQGQGFILKPVVEAIEVPVSELSALLLDRIVVRFKDELGPLSPSQAEDAISALLDGQVEFITGYPPKNYFVLRLPASISLLDAINTLENSVYSPVFFEYVLPDSLIEDRLLPCDPAFDAVPFTAANIPAAWDVTTGVPDNALIAVVDTGFDLKHPDLLANIYINENEFFGDTEDCAPLPIQDTNGNFVLDFFDINTSPLTSSQRQMLDLDGDGVITPHDVVDVCSDYQDDDANGFEDDIVGWDFGEWDHFVDSSESRIATHGTHMLGLIGAEGSTDPNQCAYVAGVNWQARILPIKMGRQPGAEKDPAEKTRAAAVSGLIYAGMQGAHVTNLSGGVTYVSEKSPQATTAENCSAGGDLMVTGLTAGKLDKLNERLRAEAKDFAFANTVYVGAATNCPIDIADRYVTDWFPRSAKPNGNVVVVTGIDAFGTVTGGYGNDIVDIGAPAHALVSLSPGGGTELSRPGTSQAAAFVSGTIGLVLSATPSLSPAQARERLLSRATANPDLIDKIKNGRVLDAGAAVGP